MSRDKTFSSRLAGLVNRLIESNGSFLQRMYNINQHSIAQSKVTKELIKLRAVLLQPWPNFGK